MATTGFWPVKKSLKSVLNYARNPDKTMDKRCMDRDLYDALKYAANDNKTDRKMFVTGINCPTERAFEQMMATKIRFGKTNGNVAYHGYQSFKSGEVTPEEAHKIGIETAKKMWGDHYEILVTTHLNTDNVHNHIVINSVSFIDGKKFENHISDHFKLREISDQICLEHGLSVIENPGHHSKSYTEWMADKAYNPTIRSLIRDDIDRAVEASTTEYQFKSIMDEMGYQLKFYNSHGEALKYPALKPPGAEVFFRFHTLGDEYELDTILEKVYANSRSKVPFPDLGKLKTMQLPEEYRPKKLHGIYALYIKYCFELHIIKKHPTSLKRVHSYLRDDIRKMDKLDNEVRFMAASKIETLEDLGEHFEYVQAEIRKLCEEQHGIYNRLKAMHRSGDDENESQIRSRLSEINAELKRLRKEARLCTSIKERSTQIEINEQIIQQEQEIQRKEYEENELCR